MRKESGEHIAYATEPLLIPAPLHGSEERDLEDHIKILRDMDQHRKNAAELRNYGITVLEQWLNTKRAEIINSATLLNDPDPTDRIEAEEKASQFVRVIGILSRYKRHRDPKTPPDSLIVFFDEFLNAMPSPTTGGPSPFLNSIKNHYLSVLFAAELTQAFVRTAGRPYSKPALLSYYWIIRELYTADAPGWNIGGARAATGGIESPYVTAQCLMAVVGFIQAQKDTAQFIAHLRRYLMQRQRVDTNTLIPPIWKEQEKKRLRYSCYIALQQYSRTLALPIEELIPITTTRHCLAEVQPAFETLKKAIAKVAQAFDEAVTEIEASWANENTAFPTGLTQKQQVQYGNSLKRQRLGHERAVLAIERGKKIADDAVNLFEDLAPAQLPYILEQVEDKLKAAITATRRILHPVENYLCTVLDHELAAATLGEDSTWEPYEMAFAAASLGILDKRWQDDKRLFKAVSHLSNVISDRGRFPTGHPFHQEGGEMHFVNPASVIGAFAELLRCCTTTVEMNLSVVKKMLWFFYDTRVQKAGVDKEITDLESDLEERGWFNEYDAKHRRMFRVSATLYAVCGLAAINRMLDEQINHVILKHFQVKRPERDMKLDLDCLFYPDYGLSEIPEKIGSPRDAGSNDPLFDDTEWPETLQPEESVAITLQRVRAHVGRISLDRGESRYCSLALHGPAGTGKTTLVEATAKSCAAPLVVVTPSDIIVGGEEAIERRARTVFEALSLLTRVVILFDEFDPVLWRRDPNAAAPRSVFAFVTPGMLPKLKDLHRWAEKRSCAYVLSTNLIGGLDEAAVREGRFDKKIGIYPPDPISRTGHLLNQVDRYFEQEDVKNKLKRPDDFEACVIAVVKSTQGGAMETLAKPEWFVAPEDYKEEYSTNPDGKLKPFAYLFSTNSNKKCKKADREAYLKEPIGEGPNAIREFIQWWWIEQWDKNINTCIELGDIDKKKEANLDELQTRLTEWWNAKKKRTQRSSDNSVVENDPPSSS